MTACPRRATFGGGSGPCRRDHFWGRVHAGQVALLFDEVAADGLAGAAADIEHGGATRK